MEKYNKQRLFEVISRLDKTFKPLNEELYDQQGSLEQPSNKKYMDDTTIENIINTLVDAKNNIQDIFEKLPIANEIPEDEAKVLEEAMTVLHKLEVRYSNENHGIGAINH